MMWDFASVSERQVDTAADVLNDDGSYCGEEDA